MDFNRLCGGVKMPGLKTKDEILEAVRRQREDWQGVLAGLGETQMEQRGAMGDWTFKDLVAHLDGWRKRTVARVEAGLSGGRPSLPDWPADLDEDDEHTVNNWIAESNRHRPLREILDESERTFDRLETALRALPEEDLVTPGRYEWMEGLPLSAIVESSLGHYYEEHGQDVHGRLGSNGPQ
jgi:hypothetical protein